MSAVTPPSFLAPPPPFPYFCSTNDCAERKAGGSQPGRWTRKGWPRERGNGGSGDGGDDGGWGARAEAWSQNDEGTWWSLKRLVDALAERVGSFRA